MISVIVPVYNASASIDRCIKSILSQSYCDFELVLVDDGSKDDSGLICERYSKIDTRVISLHKENGGVSSARNMGVEHAKGDWISFVDSDDWIDPELLQSLVWHSSGVDFVVSSYNHDNSITERVIKKACDKQEINSFLSSKLSLSPWAKLYKRDIIENAGLRFDTKIHFGEDTVFVWNYTALCESISICGFSLYNYDGVWGGDNEKYILPLEQIVYTSEKKKEALELVKNNWGINSYDKNLLWGIGHLEGLYDRYNDMQIYELYCRLIQQVDPDVFFKSLRLSRHLDAILMLKWYYKEGRVTDGRRFINALSHYFTVSASRTSLMKTNRIIYILVKNKMRFTAHLLLRCLSRFISLA